MLLLLFILFASRFWHICLMTMHKSRSSLKYAQKCQKTDRIEQPEIVQKQFPIYYPYLFGISPKMEKTKKRETCFGFSYLLYPGEAHSQCKVQLDSRWHCLKSLRYHKDVNVYSTSAVYVNCALSRVSTNRLRLIAMFSLKL